MWNGVWKLSCKHKPGWRPCQSCHTTDSLMLNKKTWPEILLRDSHFKYVVLRALVGVDRVCPVWWSPWLPEEEPGFEWYLLQRPGYQTQNQSDITTADEICLANRWWNELLIFEKGESWLQKRTRVLIYFLYVVLDNCKQSIKGENQEKNPTAHLKSLYPFPC